MCYNRTNMRLILAVPYGVVERIALFLAVPFGESGAPILRAERGSAEYAVVMKTPSVTARTAVTAFSRG